MTEHDGNLRRPSTIRMSDELRDKLKLIARANNRTLNVEINDRLEKSLCSSAITEETARELLVELKALNQVIRERLTED